MSDKNIFLFTGEEKFLLHQQLSKWRDSFIKKYWEENFFVFKSDEIKTDILNIIFGWSLLSSKKLIYIFGLPEDTDSSNKITKDTSKIVDSLERNFDLINLDTILVFISYKPDRRKSFYKFLSKKSTIKEFKKLTDKQILEFVKWYWFDDEISQYIISKVWNDLYALNNELKKIKFVLKKENATKNELKKIIDNIVYIHQDVDSFKILDDIIFQNKNIWLQMDKLKQEDIFKFLWLIFWWLKTTIQILTLYKKWITDTKQISSKIGVHPFVISTRLKKIDKLLEKQSFLEKLFDNLFDLEINIKTGKIPSELFWREFKNIILKSDDKEIF